MSYVRLILAAICAIPALVLQICILPIILLCHIPLSYFLIIHDPSWKKNKNKKVKKTSVPAVAISPSSSSSSSTSSLPIVQQQRQIIVIGGSTGIGYAIAMAAAKEASKQQQQQPQDSSAVVIPISRIVIVARNLSKLQLAQQSLMNVLHEGNQSTKKNTSIKEEKTVVNTTIASTRTTSTTSVEIVSVDVTDPIAITKAAQEIMTTTSGASTASTTTTYGSTSTTTTTPSTTTTTPTATTSTMMITHLFVCVGEAQPLHHTQITNEQYHQATLMNQLGTIYTTNAFLPHFKQKKQTGNSSISNSYSTITYTCSMGGQCGVYGYTSYAPTKFALRGYVETLHMELYADNNNNDNNDTPPIYIQIAYPPDTDTPGYSRENETKPKLTQLISEVAGLATPEQVGTKMYSEATVIHRPLRYQLYFNFDGFLLCTLASGFTPVTTWFDALFQVTIMNLVRIIALFYLNDWHRIIINNNNKNNGTRNSPSKSSDGLTTATTTAAAAAAAAKTTTTTSSSKSNNDDSTIRSSTADDPLKND